jgi:hypothetical protein
MGSISAAFSSFFGILFSNDIPADVAASLGWVKRTSVVATPAAAAAPVKKEPVVGPADGALQLLGILQRDARLVDFLMENLSAYSDEQIGAAVRNVQEQSRQALDRYVKLDPVIDGVEGTYVKTPSSDANLVKLTGNVPADGKAAGGTLRHKGWRAAKVDLPPVFPHQKTDVVAPAELEIE